MLEKLLRNIILILSSCDSDTNNGTKIKPLNIKSDNIQQFGRIDETNSLKKYYNEKDVIQNERSRI